TLDIKLAKDIVVDSVKAGDTTVNTYGVSIANANPNKTVSLTASGLNNGNNRITNVEAGQAGTDAVNKDQLDAAKASATTKVVEGKNVKVSEKTNDDGSKTYTVATADDVAFNKVTVGGVVVDGTSNKISGLANGDVSASSTDAINGSQLRNTAGDIANIIGGNAAVDNAGNVTASNIGGTGKDNINDAIVASKTEVAAGDNVTVTTSTGSNGQTIYTVSSSLAAGAGSVNYTDGSGNVVAVTAANQIQAVTDGNGNVSITNLANGEVSPTSTQAINGSQLYALGDQINNRIDDLEKEAHAGIASAMAMEYAPYVPGKYTYAAGVAYSGGESAVGLTLRKTADNGRWSVTGGVSVATEGDPSVRLGISGIIK
ncbi:MAG: YadA-like family protein, partial [Moraxella sp.]|nr:YadA-like family protein [Moraxella sp.]